MLTRQQQDDLIALIRRKGYRPRGRGGFLDRLGVGDAMTLDLLPEASWRWAVEYLAARPDVGVHSKREETTMSEMTVAIGNAERALVMGDLAKLTADERQAYYLKVCESVGLNPLTQPFAYLTLNGKLILYAKRDATDQLRKLHGVSITSLAAAERDGVYIVTATAKDAEGRTDVANGAVTIGGLKGDHLANAIMKAESKAKRRVTLSLCGLGFLDETEVETIPEAHVTQQPTNRLPPPKTDLKTRCLDYESRLVAKGACKPGELMAYVASMADQDGFDLGDWSKWQDEASDAYSRAVKSWGETRLAAVVSK